MVSCANDLENLKKQDIKLYYQVHQELLQMIQNCKNYSASNTMFKNFPYYQDLYYLKFYHFYNGPIYNIKVLQRCDTDNFINIMDTYPASILNSNNKIIYDRINHLGYGCKAHQFICKCIKDIQKNYTSNNNIETLCTAGNVQLEMLCLLNDACLNDFLKKNLSINCVELLISEMNELRILFNNHPDYWYIVRNLTEITDLELKNPLTHMVSSYFTTYIQLVNNCPIVDTLFYARIFPKRPSQDDLYNAVIKTKVDINYKRLITELYKLHPDFCQNVVDKRYVEKFFLFDVNNSPTITKIDTSISFSYIAIALELIDKYTPRANVQVFLAMHELIPSGTWTHILSTVINNIHISKLFAAFCNFLIVENYRVDVNNCIKSCDRGDLLKTIVNCTSRVTTNDRLSIKF